MPSMCRSAFSRIGRMREVVIFLVYVGFRHVSVAEWPSNLPSPTGIQQVLIASMAVAERGDFFSENGHTHAQTSSYKWEVTRVITNKQEVADFVGDARKMLRKTDRHPAASGYAQSYFLVSNDKKIVGSIHWQETGVVLVESGAEWAFRQGVVRCEDETKMIDWIGESQQSWPPEKWKATKPREANGGGKAAGDR